MSRIFVTWASYGQTPILWGCEAPPQCRETGDFLSTCQPTTVELISNYAGKLLGLSAPGPHAIREITVSCVVDEEETQMVTMSGRRPGLSTLVELTKRVQAMRDELNRAHVRHETLRRQVDELRGALSERFARLEDLHHVHEEGR